MARDKVESRGTPLPVKDRPKCLRCKRSLVPYWSYHWPQATLKAHYRTLEGYGYAGWNHFCSLKCGWRWAEKLASNTTHLGR